MPGLQAAVYSQYKHLLETQMSFKPCLLSRHIAASCLFLMGASSVLADTQLEEVIVTADFYDSTLNSIPSSITLIDSAAIEQRNASHLEDLFGLAPNVNFATGASRGRFIQIRGIGERSEFIEPVNYSVGVLIDGIDFTGISTAASTLDIQQVEVLRGPQGTLYGANALAGLINMVSNGPTEQTEGNLQVTLGNYDTRTFSGAVGGALTDAVGYRIAAQSTKSDGYTRNSFLNRDDTQNIDETTIRARLDWDVSEQLDIGITAFYADIDNGYDAFSFESNRVTRSDEPGNDRQETKAFAITTDWLISDGLRLDTVVSHASSDIEYSYDEDWSNPTLCQLNTCPFGDYSSFDSYFRDNSNTSVDVRLISAADDSDLSWVLGVYHRDQQVDLERIYTFDAPFSSQFDTQNTAVFGDWSVSLDDQWSVSIGGRVERRETDYSDIRAPGFSVSENLWGTKLSLSYAATESQLLYAAISRGYKPGGINTNATLTDSQREFSTETAWNYELGLKGDYLDNRLHAEITLFYQERDDIQLDSTIVTPGNPPQFNDFIDNATSGTNYGLEAQLDYAVLDTTSLYASIGLLQTSYNDYLNFQHVDTDRNAGNIVNLNGRDQPQAPNHQLVAGIRSQFTDRLTVDINVENRDDYFLSNDHSIRATSYSLLNANLSYTVDDWQVSVWGKNLTDRDYQTRGFGSFGNDPRNGYATEGYFQLGAPRTFGLTARYQF